METELRNAAKLNYATQQPLLYIGPPPGAPQYQFCAMMNSFSNYRLPDIAKPINYDLTIKTDLKNLLFEGLVKIQLRVIRETDFFVFNSVELRLVEVSLEESSLPKNPRLKATSVEIDKQAQQATARFSRTFQPNAQVTLWIRFGAPLNNSIGGYYYGEDNVNGVTQRYSVAFFSPTDAKRGFPCWDEPSYKAKFDVTMISAQDSVNLSNMPIKDERACDVSSKEHIEFAALFDSNEVSNAGWKVSRFQTSPPMSTYLVVLANGPFKYLETSYCSPLSGTVRPIRVYALEHLVHQAGLVMDVTTKVTPFYEKQFGVEYPLPKLDTLVIESFVSGAMEGWGMILAHPRVALMDPASESFQAKKLITSTQAHEIAHQWFGNIVTPAWWDNLWLNEGFATMMGDLLGTHFLHPEWNMEADFVTTLHEALTLDSSPSSHPVQMPIGDPGTIGQIFDQLSYAKAGSVLRMLSEFVGGDKFLRGVSNYLQKHQFGNTVETDLWESISEQGMDISAFIDNWITKTGYPVITVEKVPGGIKIRQHRFNESGASDPEGNDTLWHVPLFITTGEKEMDRTMVLKEREITISIDSTRPYLLNSRRRGVYRVQYPIETLRSRYPSNLTSILDRRAIISDITALGKAGLSETSEALQTIKRFDWDKTYYGCLELSNASNEICDVFWEHGDVHIGLLTFRSNIFVEYVRRLGFDPRDRDTLDDSRLRTLAIQVSAECEEPWVVDELLDRFSQYLEGENSSAIHPDLFPAAIANLVRWGGDREWNVALDIYRNPKSPDMKRAALVALAAAKSPEIVDRNIAFSRAPDGVADQDVLGFYNALSTNPAARRRVAEDAMENWDSIEKRLGYLIIPRIPKPAFGRLASEVDASMIEVFFKEKNTSQYDLALAQALDSIRASAKWVERSKEDVKRWLTRNGL